MGRLFKNQDGKPLYIRYRNRKIYCTQTSSYTTISKVLDLIEKGETPIIYDKKTNEENTGVILAREVVNTLIVKHDLSPTLDEVKDLMKLVKSWGKRKGDGEKMTVPSLKRTVPPRKKEKSNEVNQLDEAELLPVGAGNNTF